MQNITQSVLNSLDSEDPRTKEVLTKLITHLHAFVKDVAPTEEEWFHAIDFLTRTGQMCTDKRQEFILFSDVLGISMLVDQINHGGENGVTESTVKGPFYTPSKTLPSGSNIANGSEKDRGEQTVVYGTVCDESGAPIEGAQIDAWQSDDIGYYDIQDVNQPEMNLRAIFKSDENGNFWFKTIKPAPYPVPTDGPVGEILRAMGRHPMRPAHIHFIISAPGYATLTTHLFVQGDEYLDSDAVFGVKESLVLAFHKNESIQKSKELGFKSPFLEVSYDFKLKKTNPKKSS